MIDATLIISAPDRGAKGCGVACLGVFMGDVGTSLSNEGAIMIEIW